MTGLSYEAQALATRAIGIAAVVLQLAKRSIVEDATVLVPERHTGSELRGGTDTSQVVVTELVPVAVQESKRTCKTTTRADFRVVYHFLSKAFAIGAIVAPVTRETVCMPLQSMSLFDLAAIRKSDVLYAKYVGLVVFVGRDLAFRGTD